MNKTHLLMEQSLFCHLSSPSDVTESYQMSQVLPRQQRSRLAFSRATNCTSRGISCFGISFSTFSKQPSNLKCAHISASFLEKRLILSKSSRTWIQIRFPTSHSVISVPERKKKSGEKICVTTGPTCGLNTFFLKHCIQIY